MTQILDKLIQSQWGKSLIMWFFFGMAALIGALLWGILFLIGEIRLVNEKRALEATNHSIEMNKMSTAHIVELQQFISRLSEVEKSKKK